MVGSPCCPRDSQESSPTPQFKSINSLALSFLGPTLTSIHDYWKKHSLDWTDISGKVMSHQCFLILLFCKVLTVAYIAHHNLVPHYLCTFISFYSPSCCFCFSPTDLLTILLMCQTCFCLRPYHWFFPLPLILFSPKYWHCWLLYLLHSLFTCHLLCIFPLAFLILYSIH